MNEHLKNKANDFIAKNIQLTSEVFISIRKEKLVELIQNAYIQAYQDIQNQNKQENKPQKSTTSSNENSK